MRLTARRLLIVVTLLLAFGASAWAGQTVHVKGYTKKDGTVVKPYDRAAPGTKTAAPTTSSPKSVAVPAPAPPAATDTDTDLMEAAYATKNAENAASARPVGPVMLRIKSWTFGPNQTATATLESGTQITLPASDLLAATGAPPSSAAQESYILPTPDSAMPDIEKYCTKRYQHQLSDRELCRFQQRQAVSKLWTHDVLRTSDGRKLRTECKADWPDDFKMESYCEERRMAALAGGR